MTWILVMYIYAGVMARGDSVTLTTIDGFATEQTCKDAAKSGETLVKGSAKDFRYVCIQHQK